MELFEIYTSGATKNIEADDSLQWRKVTKACLEHCDTNYKVKVFIPEYYFNYHTDHPKTDKQCMKHFMYRLDRSELMIVNLNNSNTSIGTGMEVQRATDNGIPIIGFGNSNIYPWIEECCDVTFETLEEALNYIEKYYLN